MARKRDPNRPKKPAVRKSGAPGMRPERWFWRIVTFFLIVLASFVVLGWIRRLL